MDQLDRLVYHEGRRAPRPRSPRKEVRIPRSHPPARTGHGPRTVPRQLLLHAYPWQVPIPTPPCGGEREVMSLLTAITTQEERLGIHDSLGVMSLQAIMAQGDLNRILDFALRPSLKAYLVCTSNGQIHEFASEDDYLQCLDEYGPEVVDHMVVDRYTSDPLL